MLLRRLCRNRLGECTYSTDNCGKSLRPFAQQPRYSLGVVWWKEPGILSRWSWWWLHLFIFTFYCRHRGFDKTSTWQNVEPKLCDIPLNRVICWMFVLAPTLVHQWFFLKLTTLVGFCGLGSLWCHGAINQPSSLLVWRHICGTWHGHSIFMVFAAAGHNLNCSAILSDIWSWKLNIENFEILAC